jgi:hypothetical protein
LSTPEPDTGDQVVVVLTEDGHAGESVLAQLLDTLEHTFNMIRSAILDQRFDVKTKIIYSMF